MAQITDWDVKILVSMLIAVLAISTVMPALGLGDADADPAEIPDFDIETNAFNFSSEIPASPAEPETELYRVEFSEEYNNEAKALPGEPGDNVVEHDTPSGFAYEFITDQRLWIITNSQTNEVETRVQDTGWFVSGDIESETFTTVAEGENLNVTSTVDGNQYNVYAEISNVTDQNNYVVMYGVEVRPGEGDFGVPVAEQIFTLAEYIGWIGEILIWGLIILVEIILNVANVIFSVVTFMISLLTYLISGYTDAVNNAPGPASLVLLIPGVLLTVVFAKVTLIFAEILR